MAQTGRRWGRALALGVIAVLGAWVAFNGPWADAARQPVPAVLQLPPLRAPEALNAFVDLQGLRAPAGADVHAAGLAALRDEPAPDADRLQWPQDPLRHCQPRHEDCVARWRAQPDATRGLLAQAAPLVARCERLAQAEVWDEWLPERRTQGPLAGVSYAALPLPQFADLTACVKALGMQAVLAAGARSRAEAQTALMRADRLARLALGGSRSLIGVMVGLNVVQSNWLLAAELKARGELDGDALMPLLAPLPAAALSPRAWAPHESRFSDEMVQELVGEGRDCRATEGLLSASLTNLLDRMICSSRLGLLPQATVQENQARWQARLATVPETGPAACEVLEAELWGERESRGFAWRNTVGRWLLDTAGTGWSAYAARQLDLELLRLTLAAQLLGQSLPAGVSLTRESAGQRFAACRARLHPGDAEATLRLPLL